MAVMSLPMATEPQQPMDLSEKSTSSTTSLSSVPLDRDRVTAGRDGGDRLDVDDQRNSPVRSLSSSSSTTTRETGDVSGTVSGPSDARTSQNQVSQTSTVIYTI